MTRTVVVRQSTRDFRRNAFLFSPMKHYFSNARSVFSDVCCYMRLDLFVVGGFSSLDRSLLKKSQRH
jgi:hypothetical protein